MIYRNLWSYNAQWILASIYHGNIYLGSKYDTNNSSKAIASWVYRLYVKLPLTFKLSCPKVCTTLFANVLPTNHTNNFFITIKSRGQLLQLDSLQNPESEEPTCQFHADRQQRSICNILMYFKHPEFVFSPQGKTFRLMDRLLCLVLRWGVGYWCDKVLIYG